MNQDKDWTDYYKATNSKPLRKILEYKEFTRGVDLTASSAHRWPVASKFELQLSHLGSIVTNFTFFSAFYTILIA